MTIKKTIYVNSAGLLTDSITNTLGFSLTGNGITFKRGDTVTLTVIFLDASGTPVALPDGNLITMAVKPLGQYETSILYAQAQVTVAGQVAAAGYDFNFTLNEATLHDALRLNEPFAPTIESVAGMLELTWSNDGTIYRSSQNAALFTITNDVIRGNETLTMALTETPETFISDRAVRYDQEQSLTVAEQQRARDNIGVDGTVEVAKSIHTTVRAEVDIQKGQAVYISGASGSNKKVRLAKADTEATSSKTIGLSSEDLVANGSGDIVTEGSLSGLSIDVSELTVAEGDPVWLSPTTAGGLLFGAANKPVAPNHMVFLGIVTRITGNTLTDIFVKVQNGFELQELHNVQITSPATGEALVYDDVAGVWKNQPVSSELQELQDVQISSVQDGEVLVYDELEGVWKNQAPSSSPVLSTATETSLSGFITGDGLTLNAKAGAELPTASTVALRDNGGRLSASMFLVHQGATSKFVQINPPSSLLTDNASLELPQYSGTIATDYTAVMLSGDQEIFGDKNFAGKVFAQTNALDDINSVVTRFDGDYRYLQLYGTTQQTVSTPTTFTNTISFSSAPKVGSASLVAEDSALLAAKKTGFLSSSLQITTTTLSTVASVLLTSAGTYLIESYIEVKPDGLNPTNATLRISTTAPDTIIPIPKFNGGELYGSTTMTHAHWEDQSLTTGFTLLRQSPAANATFSRRVEGILVIAHANYAVRLEARLSAASATNTFTCKPGAYISATKIA